MRQLLGAAFLTFGFTFFVYLQGAYKQLALSNIPTGYYILEDFFTCFVFAANMSVVFLVLHLLQWFVSSRVRTCAARRERDAF